LSSKTLPTAMPAVAMDQLSGRAKLTRMRAHGVVGSVSALRRKLRAITSLAEDSGATASERENAQTVKKRLEQKLAETEAPAGDWTDNAFRLGRWVREFRQSAPPASTDGDWTDHARRLGKAVRRGYKKWSSE
jgi:hypothetical protein